MTHYLVDLLVVVGGLILLIGLAVTIGQVDARSRDQAWRRIADARRIQRQRERVWLDRPVACPCEHCPFQYDVPVRFDD